MQLLNVWQGGYKGTKKKFKQKGNLPAFYIAHKNMEKKFKYPYCQ